MDPVVRSGSGPATPRRPRRRGASRRDGRSRPGMHDEQLESELDVCRDWVARHPEAFLAAGVFVQAIGLALRPQISTRWIRTWHARQKTFGTSRRPGGHEASCSSPIGSRPLSPESVAGRAPGRLMAATRSRPRPQVDWTFRVPFRSLPSPRSTAPLLAAQGSETNIEPVRSWPSGIARAPAGRGLWRSIQPPASDTEPVTITFYDSHDLPAMELVGQPVVLRDYSTHIERERAQRGRSCSLGELARARRADPGWTRADGVGRPLTAASIAMRRLDEVHGIKMIYRARRQLERICRG